MFTRIRYIFDIKRSQVELSSMYCIELGSAKEVFGEVVMPILSIFARMTIEQIATVASSNTNTKLTIHCMSQLTRHQYNMT